jgi:Uma2 family endonuclease
MTLATTKTRFTPEELERLPGAVNFELVGGNLVERNMGSKFSAIALRIGSRLVVYVERHQLGHVFTTDCGYQCFSDDPDKLRKPDVSFVSRIRLPGEPPDGYIKIAPDLAVEVLSPGDLASDVEEKVQEYLGAGVKLIWIVSPNTRTVRIRRPAGAKLGPAGELTEADAISGEDVVPGFECRVAEFFEI